MELEIAAKEQMKITELRMAKLFSEKAKVVSQTESTKPQGMLVILPNPLLVCGLESSRSQFGIKECIFWNTRVICDLFLLSCLL